MRMFMAAVLLSLSSLACAPEEREYFIGDLSFSLKERSEIERGNLWLAEMTGEAPVEIRWERLPDTGRERTIERKDLPGNVIGSTDKIGSIWLDTDKGADRIAADFAHELAHVKGYNHHNGPGLMNQIVPITLTWSVEDSFARAER